MTDLNLRAARIQLYGLIAAVIFAIVIALGITSGAFVLSFAVLRDLALQAGIPDRWSWILPLIIDGAILGSTIAAVALSKISGNDKGRTFFVALLVAVVCISVIGNAYHAYRAAEIAARAVAAGTHTGTMPLSPTGAALIAVIPPLLVLAFTHGIGLLIKGIGTCYSEYNALVRALAADQPGPADATSSAADENSAPQAIGDSIDAHNDVASSLSSAATGEAEIVTSAEELHSDADESLIAILDFVDSSPDLDDNVRHAARRKLLNPKLPFALIAEETGVVTSTAQRRYKRAEAAALAAGLAMPHQPELNDHVDDEHLDEDDHARELVRSR